LALRYVFQDVFRIDPPLGLISRLPTHRPRKALLIAEMGSAGGDEKLRHLLSIHVLPNGIVGWCTEALEDEQNFIVLHEFACLLDSLGWAESIVVGNKVDLSSVDAALGVDLVKKSGLRPAYQRVGRQRTAVRHDISDLDLMVGGAG